MTTSLLRLTLCSLLVFGAIPLRAATAPTPAPAKAPAEPNFAGKIAAKLKPTRRVVYKRIDGRELNLEIFEPTGWKANDHRPAFVSIHGGGWTGGGPSAMYPFTQYCADLGMLAISVQYRLYKPGTDVTVFECVKDARSAMRYVRSHAAELGIDPQKIIANGASAGGHLAVGTALFDGIDTVGEDTSVSCVPNALVLFSPVIDTSTEGYGNTKIGSKWEELSPADRVKPGMPPTITFHGTGDTTTPFKGAQKFQEAMIRAGNRSQLIVVEGEQHTYMFKDAVRYAECQKQLAAFFASAGLLPGTSTTSAVK